MDKRTGMKKKQPKKPVVESITSIGKSPFGSAKSTPTPPKK
jgi:hypothetical protein